MDAKLGHETDALNFLADLAREHGCYGMWVLTEEDNAVARRFQQLPVHVQRHHADPVALAPAQRQHATTTAWYRS